MKENIRIREMNISDIDEVVDIHSKELKDSFLGKLNYGFLLKLYSYMLEEESFKCFVAECNSKVCGYIAITLDSGEFYKRIYKKHLFSLVVEIMSRSIRQPILIVQSLEIFLSKTPSVGISNIRAELLSIAVANKFKFKGIGKKLVGEALAFLKSIKEESIFVIVNINNIAANKFYESIGFIKKGQLSLHRDIMNLYIFDVKRNQKL